MNIQNINSYILPGYSPKPINRDSSDYKLSDDLDKVTLSSTEKSPTYKPQRPLIQKKGYDYYINENSRLTVKIVDKESGKTLKEIPSQDEQKIHKAFKVALENL